MHCLGGIYFSSASDVTGTCALRSIDSAVHGAMIQKWCPHGSASQVAAACKHVRKTRWRWKTWQWHTGGLSFQVSLFYNVLVCDADTSTLYNIKLQGEDLEFFYCFKAKLHPEGEVPYLRLITHSICSCWLWIFSEGAQSSALIGHYKLWYTETALPNRSTKCKTWFLL